MLKNRVGSRSRGFGKVSKKMAEMPIIKVTCGNVKGRLHKNKFYCPGIHRECIEYQGRFITPKTFSVMGDKEKLKDWKNALRINGIQVRKYIESGTLDFNRHDEFCTGRCIARSPVNRANQSVPGSLIPKVEFVSSINEHTYCHLPDDSEHMGIPNIPTVEMRGDPEPVDVKPNVALLQSLLEKPPASTVDVLPPDVAAALSADKDIDCEPISIDPETAEEDRQFWVGIMELGLLEHFFREIKINLDVYKTDLVTHQVRLNDAVRISSVVRSMGLMRKFKKRLASFKSDMDQQQAKIDAEMEALKQQVTQYELRKQALKRKSEKFELLMDMSANKKAFIIEKNIDNSEDENNEDGNGEVVDICYENDEDDDEEEEIEDDDDDDDDDQEDMEVPEEIMTQKVEFGEKQITVPTVTKVKTPARPVSPVRITTLPSDSSGSYVIKNNPTKQPKTFHPPTSTLSAPPKPDPTKKVTIIRQVLMDTGNDGDAMEKLKEAAVLKLKESLANKADASDSTKQMVNTPKTSSPVTLTLNTVNTPKTSSPVTLTLNTVNTPKTSSPVTLTLNTVNTANTNIVPVVKPAAPAKEKIKIIARCKPVVDSAPLVSNQNEDILVSVHRSIPVSSSSLSLTPTILTYSPTGHSLTSTATASSLLQAVPLKVVQQETPTKNKCEEQSKKSDGLPITKDLKVVVQPIEIKKRKPGPKSKTEYYEPNMKTTKEVLHDDPNKVTFESGSQTPIDGVRENLPSQEEKSKAVVSARRSNRKTAHMFSWGMKVGNESQEIVVEDSDSFPAEEVLTVENSSSTDLSPTKEKFTWDLE